jgi:class 3 adenylate cyclase
MSEGGLVTILFTDLVGSTELASDMGDVAADDLRRQHFADLREAIAATGGTEVKTIGDAVMVSYKGATDALAGGVAMQRAVERRNRGLEARRLEMRVGVSAGDATFEDGDWFGTPVVEASRLCGAAAGGQILVSDLVRALAGSRCEFTLDPLGTRELKGLPAPIAVCDVDWRVPQDSTVVPLPTFVDTAPGFPFAGRSEAFETLLLTWKETLEGARRAVLVSGEPGIGKTRLVTELVRHAHEAGTSILWGRCDEELGAPFEPFAEALRHYSACVPVERLRAELGPLGGELTRMIPDLAARVPGLAAPVTGDAETERHRLFEAVTDFLAEMSHTDPVILVLDDVHWADKPSLLLLRHVLRSGSPMRLLVLATYRDTDLDRTHPLSEVLADLRREPGVTRLDLAGLDASEVTALMEATAGHDLGEPGVGLAQAVQQETQGNPFFVGEVLRNLAESGAIVQRDGTWTVDRSLGDVGIPEGIREVVGRRLSRLSEAANRALAVAAVIGAQFDLATIEAAGGPAGDELFDALDQAVQHSIVREVPGAFGRYTFAHALVRSALYEELTTNRRVRMHWQVGLALEARYAQRDDAHLDELAYHFAEGALAGDPLKAVEYGQRRPSMPTPSSHSRARRGTTSGRWARSSSSMLPIRCCIVICRSRWRRRSTTPATGSTARRSSRRPRAPGRPATARGWLARPWSSRPAAARATRSLIPNWSSCSKKRSRQWAKKKRASAPVSCPVWRSSCSGAARWIGACSWGARRSHLRARSATPRCWAWCSLAAGRSSTVRGPTATSWSR